MSDLPVTKPQRPAPSLSFVVPCYNEEEVLAELLRQLSTLSDWLLDEGAIAGPAEIVLIDDGSRDATWSLIAEARAQHNVTGVKLSRNHGHQRALLAGLMSASGEVLISLDADLQDDVAVIPKMLAAWRDGAEIVFGVRDSRHRDTWFKRKSAQSYYGLLRAMGVDVLPDHADFRLMSRKAIETLRDFGEVNLYLRGLVRTIGYDSAIVTYARGERFAGETKYPLAKMLGLAIDGVTSFSVKPLRLVTYAGLVIAFLAFAYVLYAVFARLAGITVPGWASIVVPIYFLGGIQLIGIGIIGEYIGKIYFETKRRPQFIIDEILRAEPTK